MNETMNQEGDQRKRDEHKREETSQARGCPPYITRGSALRPTPFLAPHFFEAFREVPRKGAFLNSDRLTPCIHQL